MAKTLTGTVSSVAPNKTIVITVATRKTHPIYKKQYTVTSKFMAHDENNECQTGDKVIIAETRPLSARKRYRLEKIIERAAISKDDLAVIDTSAKTDEPDEGEAKASPAKSKTSRTPKSKAAKESDEESEDKK
jgi:small subunit ribosomal protein S17